jgi:hypothetical protein
MSSALLSLLLFGRDPRLRRKYRALLFSVSWVFVCSTASSVKFVTKPFKKEHTKSLQYFLVLAIFLDSGRASLVNWPFAISTLVYILGFGFSQSSSVNLATMGVYLEWCSTLFFYALVGVAVSSTYLTISSPTVRNMFFIAVFIIAGLGLLVFGIVTLGKDDRSGLLLVSSPWLRRHDLTEEGFDRRSLCRVSRFDRDTIFWVAFEGEKLVAKLSIACGDS